MKHFTWLLILAAALSACSNEKPRPEGEETVPMEVSMLGNESVETAVQPRQLNVTHHVKGSNVYIECYIPNFSFSDKRGEKVNGEGYLNLYIDGKKTDEIHTAAFIIKGLDKGTHTIYIEVLHNDSSRYHLKKTWNVTI